jgi:hypothetical protein
MSGVAGFWWRQREHEYGCALCSLHGETYLRSSAMEMLDHLVYHRDELGVATVTEAVLEPLRVIVLLGHSYDERCRALAEVFLDDVPASTEFDRCCLAQAIQSAIESWLVERDLA